MWNSLRTHFKLSSFSKIFQIPILHHDVLCCSGKNSIFVLMFHIEHLYNICLIFILPQGSDKLDYLPCSGCIFTGWVGLKLCFCRKLCYNTEDMWQTCFRNLHLTFGSSFKFLIFHPQDIHFRNRWKVWSLWSLGNINNICYSWLYCL